MRIKKSSHKSTIKIILFALLFNTFFLISVFAAGSTPTQPKLEKIPDLIKEIPENTTKDFLLGPTGLRGWMYTRAIRLSPQDLTSEMSTEFSRQILITEVEENSPAHKLISIGDVLLGINDKPFMGDPRRELAKAINIAEEEENKGQLTFLIWRPNVPNKKESKTRSKGNELKQTITLKVLGSFSKTAPFNCSKSDIIRKQTIEAVYREELNSNLNVWALALLSTGEEKHINKAKSYIDKLAKTKYDPKEKTINRGKSWAWGYQLILMCEYYFLTNDKSVLPGIKELAVTLSLGQSITGTWGHYMAQPKYNDGRIHARLEGYATLNQPSLTCFMGLAMAEKCGIKDPEFDKALAKVKEFYEYYIEKGGIPYGYNTPREYLLSNNGTSATAALTFAVYNHKKGARFFSSLCGGAADKVEIGHTGAFFNSMWTGLGANIRGPEVYSGYFKDWTWRRTLTRKWNGGYVFQRAGGGKGLYGRIGPSSAMLLHLCLPLRKLHITGKNPDKSDWLSGEQATEIVKIRSIKYTEKNTDELLKLLIHDLPLARREAAEELAKRDYNILENILKLLKGNRNQKIGATNAISQLKERGIPFQDALMTIVRNRKEELWVRHKALEALSKTGETARGYIPELLNMLVGDLPEDHRRHLELNLAWAISSIAEKPYHEKNNKKLIFKAAEKLLTHPHMRGRTEGMRFIENIGLDDFHLFTDQIVHVIRNKDPSYLTYHWDRSPKFGLNILERLNIKEGIDLGMETIYPGIWGQRYRIGGEKGRLAFLQKYGKSAIPYIDKLSTIMGPSGNQTIEAIKSSNITRELITFEEAIKAGKKKKDLSK